MPKDPWKGVEPERRDMAQSIFAAAKQIAEEDGDGEFNLSSFPPQLQAIGGGFNRLVSRAARGELDENDPKDVTDALRVASAALVDARQPEQFQGLRWMTGGQPLIAPGKFNFADPEAFGPREREQPFGPQETPYIEGRTPEGEPIYRQPATMGGWEPEVKRESVSRELQEFFEKSVQPFMNRPPSWKTQPPGGGGGIF